MKTTQISKIALCLLFGIFASPASFGQEFYDSIVHNDSTRTYHLYVPANYTGDTPVPLVLDLHWYNGTGHAQMGTSSFRWISDTAGFISVHPDGLRNPEGDPHWSVGHWIGNSSDDVGFLSALIDSLAAEYNIDLERVYSTGTSNGGFMSFHLACHLCDRIAAIAPVASSMTIHTYDACTPTHPMPVLFIHGTADPEVLVEGTYYSKSVDEVLNYWVSNNNCNTEADTIHFPDNYDTDTVAVDRISFKEGDGDVHVEYLKINNGIHKWWNNADISTTLEVWKFFSQYDINGRIGYVAPDKLEETSELELKCYPNPAVDFITLEFQDTTPLIQRIQVFNSQGQLVGQESFESAAKYILDIDVSEFETGLYIIRCGEMVSKFSVLR